MNTPDNEKLGRFSKLENGYQVKFERILPFPIETVVSEYPELKKKRIMKNPFVIERTYQASVDRVWSAITNKDEMKYWYFDLAAFVPEVGFEFQFKGGKDEARPYLHLCQVTEVIPGKKITYSWRYEGYEGISYVTFELFEEGKKTRLKLSHAGLESFPVNNPDFAKENFIAGWTDIIGSLLKDYLNPKA